MIEIAVGGYLPLNAEQASKTALTFMGPTLKTLHEPYWRRQERPDGSRWKPRQDQSDPDPILRETGRMFREVEFRFRDGNLEAVTTEYGAAHQFGTDRMTEREWVGFPEEAVDAYVNKVIDILNG